MHKLTHNNKVLWTLQFLLAALYLFAGGVKVVASAAALSQPGSGPALPIWFLRLVGMLECLGAAGLILPGITGIRRGLTPLAAACLFVIMVGAVITSLPLGPAVLILPVVAGILDIVVAVGRRDWASARTATAFRREGAVH
jgi:hypothetical protein